MPALLPAAEVLLRDVLDARLKHWKRAKGRLAPQDVVLEARCTASQDTQTCTMQLLPLSE